MAFSSSASANLLKLLHAFFGAHEKKIKIHRLYFIVFFYSRPSFVCKQNRNKHEKCTITNAESFVSGFSGLLDLKIIITFLCEIYCEGLNMQVLWSFLLA